VCPANGMGATDLLFMGRATVDFPKRRIT